MKTFKPFRFAFAAVATVALALAAGPALAHAKLLSELPAADGAASAPLSTTLTDVRLAFSESLNLAFSKLVVTDGAGAKVALGALSLDPKDDKVLIAPLTATLPVGEYKVDWTAVSNDGHKTTGTYAFKVAK